MRKNIYRRRKFYPVCCCGREEYAKNKSALERKDHVEIEIAEKRFYVVLEVEGISRILDISQRERHLFWILNEYPS